MRKMFRTKPNVAGNCVVVIILLMIPFSGLCQSTAKGGAEFQKKLTWHDEFDYRDIPIRQNGIMKSDLCETTSPSILSIPGWYLRWSA